VILRPSGLAGALPLLLPLLPPLLAVWRMALPASADRGLV
jgi:hypothetical protein